MYSWHRLSQYHSLIEGDGGYALIERHRSKIAVYSVIHFEALQELLWLTTLTDLTENEKRTRVTQQEKYIDVDISDKMMRIVIRHENNKTVVMAEYECVQLMLLLRTLERRTRNPAPGMCGLCEDHANDAFSPVPNELSFAFSAIMSAMPTLPGRVYYGPLCQDLTESLIEKWNDENTPYWHSQLHAMERKKLEAGDRCYEGEWKSQTIKDTNGPHPIRFQWIPAENPPVTETETRYVWDF